MLQKGISVDLAQVTNPREMQSADQDDAIILAISRDGGIFLGSTKVNKEDITSKVRDLVANRLDKTVFVKSDARAKYGVVVAVVDEVRAAGVDQLGLLTERKETGRRPPLPPPTGGS